MRQVIHGELYLESTEALDQLCETFQHIVRYGYNRLLKKDVKLPIRKHCEDKFSDKLNKRWIRDAFIYSESLHKRLKGRKVIFGGRQNWEKLKTGKISKAQWLSARNHHCYARGEASKFGNLNCRIIGNSLRINFGERDYQIYPLHVSSKKTSKMESIGRPSDQERLAILESLANSKQVSYGIRFRKKDSNHYAVHIEYECSTPSLRLNLAPGALGVDCNTDRIALAEINGSGNLLNSSTIKENRILFARKSKRFNDISCLATKIVSQALRLNKCLVVEDLKFKSNPSRNRKLNRKLHNFSWKKFINLLGVKCKKAGVTCLKVNPAYTSWIGNLKYAGMHKISGHEAAAYVIARRGLGMKEKLSLYRLNKSLVKEEVVRTLVGKYGKKHFNNWKLWSSLKSEAVLTEPRSRLRNLKEFRGCVKQTLEREQKFSGESFSRTGRGGTSVTLVSGDERPTISKPEAIY